MSKLTFVLCMVLFASAGCSTQPLDQMPASTLLNHLISENQKASQKINSYSYHIETQFKADNSDTRPVYHGVGQVRRQNTSLYSAYRQTLLDVAQQRMQEIEKRVVVNPDYAAMWPIVNQPAAYQYDHLSVQEMDPTMATRIQLATPLAVVPYAFGDTERTLSESVHLRSEAHWDAVAVSNDESGGDSGDSGGAGGGASGGGGMRYFVRRFLPTTNDPQKPDAVWQIDPAQGYLITAITVYKNDGAVWIHRKITARKLTPDVWFPVGFDEQYFGNSRDVPAQQVTRWQKATLTHVQVNEAYDPAQFQVGALRLKEDMPSVTLFRKKLTGEQATYQYQGDQLVPQFRRR